LGSAHRFVTDETLTDPTLPIHDLAARHLGLTDAVASYYTEAARVCLDRHHASPVGVQIDNAGTGVSATVDWVPTDERTRNAHANEIDATEAGAYACVLAAVELLMRMVAIHRAETATGADYYIAPTDSMGADLEEALRLEVSGIDKGSLAAVTRRLNVKLEQAAKGASNLPALAGVVGFRARLIMLRHVPRS
jgi:hypothetical protein